MWFRRDGNLQTMCLKVIAANIRIITLPNAVPEKHIEFLRRAYSEALFKFYQEGCYSKEFLVWLISPYWKNVSLPGLGCLNSEVLSKFRCVGKKIESLNLEYSDFDPYFLSAMICSVPKITVLNFTGTLITDDMLVLIKKLCPNLKNLNVSQCESLTDLGIRNLCYSNNELTGYPSLETLNISETNVKMKGLYQLLEHLTSLKVLIFEPTALWLWCIYGKLVTHGCNEMGAKYEITNLEYSDTTPYATIDVDLVLELMSIICQELEDVSLKTKLTQKSFELLTKFEFLKRLKLYNNNHRFHSKSPTLSPFLSSISGSVLTDLKLYLNISLSADVITNCCPNLECLELYGVKYEEFESPDDAKVVELKKLKLLHFDKLFFKSDLDFKSVVLLLKSGINLNNVSIRHSMQLTHTITSVILQLPELTEVDFSFTDITEEVLLPFFTCPSVKKIHVDGCPRISVADETSFITKLMNSKADKNTCSWELGYDE